MEQKIKIAPSVLAADFTKLGSDVQETEQHGADLIHIDVMDGRFVPNISMGPMVVEAIKQVTNLPLDVHLMIEEPERHITAFAKAGASAITVHLEASPHLHRTLQQIRALGIRAGVAINPHTPASLLSEIIGMVDIVLVMTVNPGFGGQKFLPEVLPKLLAIHQMLRSVKHPVDVTVDGGIDAQTAPYVLKAGANVLVAGSSIFQAEGDIAASIAVLNAAINAYERPRSI